MLCGLGVGWLIGMSVSPVLGSVVGGFVATLLAIVGILVGLDSPKAEPRRESGETREATTPTSPLHRIRPQIDVLPLTCVVLSIIAGAVVGVYGLTHQWLAPNPHTFISKWQGVGLTHEQAVQLLVRASFGGVEGAATKTEAGSKEAGKPELPQSALSPVLFATVAPEECVAYENLYGHGDELVRALAASSDERVRTLTKHLWKGSKNARTIELVTRDLICAPERP